MFPLKITSLVLFCVAYLALELGVWTSMVPDVLSPATFAWMTAIGLIATAAALRTAANAQPTRSIAHVLYDVEHDAKAKR